jgi:hypothetical protein
MTVRKPFDPLINDSQISRWVEYFSSKLAMRVRFPSPAPPTAARSDMTLSRALPGAQPPPSLMFERVENCSSS